MLRNRLRYIFSNENMLTWHHTESQKEELGKLAAQKGKALAELIREAIDMYIVENKLKTEDHIIETSGLWKDRDDIDSEEYITSLRHELNLRLEDNSL